MTPNCAETPSISVVIPLYNGAGHVVRALDGVFAQTLQPTEVIVVDDGSEDGGADRVRRLAAPLPVRVYGQANAGQSAARNRGVSLASGEWIAFLDQDDFWRPQHLEKLSNAAASLSASANADAGWVYTNVDLVDAEGQVIRPSFLHTRAGSHPKASVLDCLRDDMFVLPSASLVSRTALNAVGGFDVDLQGYEDDDLFLRLMLAGYAHAFVDEPLVMFRFHEKSASRSAGMVRSLVIYAGKLFAMFPDEPRRGSYPARDILAPRFRRALLVAHVHAVVKSDAEGTKAVKEAAEWLRPHLSAHAYWSMRGLMKVLSHAGPAKAGLHIGRWLQSVAKTPKALHRTPSRLTQKEGLACSPAGRDQQSHGS